MAVNTQTHDLTYQEIMLIIGYDPYLVIIYYNIVTLFRQNRFGKRSSAYLRFRSSLEKVRCIYLQ